MSMIPILEYAMNGTDEGEAPLPSLPSLLIEREYYRLIAEDLSRDITADRLRAAVVASKAELRKLPGIV